MSYQITKLDLIPKGEKPVCNASQFDNGRVLSFEIYENSEAYSIPNDIRVELHCRKPDGNIVTLPSDTITENTITFISTTQLTACYGDNDCEIALYGHDDYHIGSLNFILEVERDPLLDGINSTSAIHDLHDQIENITEEVIGENYYNKTEVDDLLDDKANAADVYTKAQVDSALDLKANAADVYTKSQVDSVLDLKANIADVYTKSQVDSALDLKANIADVYTKSQVDSALDLKANAADVYTKSQVDNMLLNIMPVDTASGAIATFDTQLANPLVSVIADVTATGGNGTPANPIPINGYTEANITRCGVNLFDALTWVTLGLNSNFYSVSSSQEITVTANDVSGIGNRLFNVVPNATYSYMSTFSNAIRIFNSDGETISQLTSGTFTAPADGRIAIKFYANSYPTTGRFILVNGSTIPIDFTPYNGNTYTIAFGQTVYGGVLHIENGRTWFEVKFLEFDLGILTPVMYVVTEGNLFRYALDDLEPLTSDYDVTKIICSNYLSVASASRANKTLSQVSNLLRFDIIDNDYNDAASMKTAMNGVEVAYPLATPFDIDLTPEVISAIVGTNNVFADCGNIEVKFKDTIQHYIDSKIGG